MEAPSDRTGSWASEGQPESGEAELPCDPGTFHVLMSPENIRLLLRKEEAPVQGLSLGQG